MTARELLRESAAAWGLLAQQATSYGDAGEVISGRWAMRERCRALADRLDAEIERAAATPYVTSAEACLSRLDADLDTTTPTQPGARVLKRTP